jgi:hypothetical protein
MIEIFEEDLHDPDAVPGIGVTVRTMVAVVKADRFTSGGKHLIRFDPDPAPRIASAAHIDKRSL